MKRVVLFTLLVLALILSLGAVTPSEAVRSCCPGCLCPDVFAPVICSDGNVYANYCYASLACATGCVPYGDI